MVKLAVDPQSTYPVHAQIKERVKLALAFGDLRPGDTLPSIRELAKELQVGAGVVRRAYSELARAGILSISGSRRVVVNRELQYKREIEGLRQETRRLAARIFDEVLALGIHPQSFAQFFQHWLHESRHCESFIIFTECNRLQAEQYAGEVAQAWGVPVRGLDFDALRQISRKNLQGTRHLLTIPYHYEEARKISRKLGKNLVTVSVHWAQEVLQRIGSLRARSRVAFVFQRRDCEQYGHWIVREVEGMFPNSGLTFGCVVLEDIEPVEDWLKRGEWNLIYFSNRIWDGLPASVRSCPHVATPKLRADPVSLEKARIEVGILS